MKMYNVRVNCGCFEDIIVEANSKEEANEKAENKFNCPANSPEAE